MKTIVFLADEDIKNTLHKYAIEVESRQSLLAFMIEHNMLKNENFIKYENQYKDYYSKYEELKQNFQKTFINPILSEKNIDPSKASWSLDFSTNEVTLSIIE